MTRTLVVLAVAAPVIALAQVSAPSGGLVEVNNFNAEVASSYVSLAHCGGEPLHVEWNIGSSGPFLADDNFKIFASDTAPSVPTGGTLAFCPEQDSTGGTTNVFAALVDTVPATRAVETLDLSATEVVVDAADLTCDEASETEVVHVCAHWTDATDAKKGVAVGTFIIQVKRPNAPASVSTTPGEGALNVSWPAATTDGGAVAARSYRVVVLQGGVEVARVDDVTARSVRVSGLQNDVTYDVQVFGLSVAKNPSQNPATTTGTPRVVDDFWERYEAAGGREQGGCSTGPAGSIALLAVAGLLAALRRRK